MNGSRLVGVGVGPGDPDLLTVKALRVLREADVVFVPVADTGELGRAERTVRAHLDRPVERLTFALNDVAPREAAWDAAGAAVAGALRESGTVAFATIGDPAVYSTFSYLARTVRELVPDVEVTTVPGITAMQDLAARSGTVLVEGSESLLLLPLTAGIEEFRDALGRHDAIVAYKGGRVLADVLTAIEAAGRLDGAVYGAALGLIDEDIRPARDLLGAGPAPYLSTVIVPPARTSRGGRL
ncbi:MAG TPA: precorrin-2 C(20)-methyltransferase [Mycobacteriales bacterium]|nr:precorrin-2 C(20)-methyltransferase [Mycobacteriales bacterium]